MAQPREDRWHVGKEIPIALIFALFIQTAGWIWWAATQSAKLDTLTQLMAQFQTTQYTQADAGRDKQLIMTQYDNLSRRVDKLELPR